MLDSGDPFLFQRSDFFAVLEATKRTLAAEVEAIPGDQFLNLGTDELADYFVKKYSFDVPQLDGSKITVDQAETSVVVHGPFGAQQVRGTKITYSIPFIGDQRFFLFQPSVGTVIPHGRLQDDELLISFHGLNLDDQQVRAEFNRQLEQVQFRLNELRNQVATFHAKLTGQTRGLVEQRRQKLQKDRTLVANLGYPLKRRDDPAAKLAIPVARRELVPKLPEASGAPPEPFLELAQYDDILGTIQNMALVIERSPRAFQHLHEGELRWLFLVPLNGLYEGQASSETFNFEGKTDILIRVRDKNIFIAECAIWNGPEYLKKKIDQLLGYATWRDSKLAIIIFNRSKDFSGVLAKVTDACKAHASFKRELPRPHETWFRCVLSHRDDPNRELTLTVLAFEVPA